MVGGVSSKEFKNLYSPPTTTVSKIQYFTHIIIVVIVMATIHTKLSIWLALSFSTMLLYRHLLDLSPPANIYFSQAPTPHVRAFRKPLKWLG